MLLEFATLKIIWWLLLGLLLIGFAVTDGFDLGVGMLLPFIGRNDTERRVLINTIGPVWEGNQVWLIVGGGAMFAAWPALYAASFSGFYPAVLLVLDADTSPGGHHLSQQAARCALARELGLAVARQRAGAGAGVWRRDGQPARGRTV
jgi:hypothetical protein